jgi:hypothetical protein
MPRKVYGKGKEWGFSFKSPLMSCRSDDYRDDTASKQLSKAGPRIESRGDDKPIDDQNFQLTH